MPTPSEQLLSRTIYDIDGTTTVWDFSFAGGYLDASHVKAYTELPTGARTAITVTPEMLIGEYQLQITPALSSSAGVLVIYRDTPVSAPLVDFVEGPLTEIALDTNAKQAVFVAAEAQDAITSSNFGAAIDAAIDAGASAAAANIDAASAASSASGAASSALSASLSASAADGSADAAALSASAASDSAIAAAASAADAEGVRTDLAATTGSSLVGYDGGTVQDVLDSAKPMTDYTALRAYTGRATSVRITTPGIAGFFRKIASGTDNGGTVIVGAFAWERVFDGPIIATWFEIGSGVADDSLKAQAAVDAAKGKEVMFPAGYSYLLAGITLNGSTYNWTRVIFDGEFLLKPSGGATNHLGRWLGVLVKDCDFVTVEIKNANGQRSLQPANEQIHILGLAGVRHFDGGNFKCREIRGDGVYLSQSDWNSSSATSENVSFDSITGTNSVDDGRNLLSVIAVNGLSVGVFKSTNIGGVIGAVRQPGGLDIEPNHSYHVVENVKIGSLSVTTAGVAGLGIIGKQPDIYGQNTCRNINFGTFSVTKNTGASGTSGVLIRNADDVVGLGEVYVKVPVSQGQSGVFVDRASGINIKANTYGCSLGAQVGVTGYVESSEIIVNAHDYGESAVQVVGVIGSSVTGRAAKATTVNSYAVRFRSWARKSLTLTGVSGSFSRGEIVTGSTSGATAQVVSYIVSGGVNYLLLAGEVGVFAAETVTGATSGATATAAVIPLGAFNSKISIEAPKLTGDLVARGYRNEPAEPITAVSVKMENADLSGYGSLAVALENCGQGFIKSNLRGVTNSQAIPTVGTWGQGDFIWRDNNSALDGNSMFTLGWMRLTNGSNNVAGVDWVTARVSNVSPAV